MIKRKVSEAFRYAINKRIPQVKGVNRKQMRSGRTGYCAAGLLDHLQVEYRGFNVWLVTTQGNAIVTLNDGLGWNWKQFLNAAKRFEKT